MTNDEVLQAAKVERDRIVTAVMLSHTEEVDGFSYRWFARRIADEVAAIIEKRTIERCAVALMDQRNELLAALNFARQGYQAASENGEPDEVEWAEMYLRSIDVAIASVKGEQ